MNSSDIWGIVGLVAAAIGLAVPFYLTKRSRLVVYVRKWTKIVDDFTRSIDGLKVSYKDTDDLRNLVRVTGFVHNVGTMDVDKSDVHAPLCLTLPGDSRWLEAECSSDHVKGTATIQGNAITFQWDLIRRNERIRFDALFEYLPPEGKGMRIDKIFSVSGRIKNASLKTLRETDVSPKPIVRVGSVWDVLFLIFYGWTSFNLFEPSARSHFYRGDKEVILHVADDGRLCFSEGVNPFLRLVPFYPKPSCQFEVKSSPVEFEGVELRLEKEHSANWWLAGFIFVTAPFIVWVTLSRLIEGFAAQRRHFGKVWWFRAPRT